MHQSDTNDLAVEKKSGHLAGLKIAICGGGGIAATELPRFARELRRHGANVRFMVTENCLRFIGRESLEWASGQSVTVNPSGMSEHIATEDAVIVFPANADLLSKTAHGICSDGTTTYIQSAFGSEKVVIFCPTMHNSLSLSPIILKNREILKSLKNCFFTAPRLEEGKEKAPDISQLSLQVCHIINRQRSRYQGIKVLVTLGGTRVSIDAVRCLTNISTGALGQMLAKNLYAAGFEVTAVCGATSERMSSLPGLDIVFLPEYTEMYAFLERIESPLYKGIFHIAAASDFLVVAPSDEKISSETNEVRIDLKKTGKLRDLPTLRSIPFKAGCKLVANEAEANQNLVREILDKQTYDLLFLNAATNAFSKGAHRGRVYKKTGESLRATEVTGKDMISQVMIEEFMSYLSRTKE